MKTIKTLRIVVYSTWAVVCLVAGLRGGISAWGASVPLAPAGAVWKYDATGTDLVSVEPEPQNRPDEPGAPLSRNLWFCNDSEIPYDRPDWMGELSDDLLLSDLSIPGTHETMALYGGLSVACQSLTLGQQLDAGVRAFDIRLRHIADVFAIHHGPVFQNAFFGDDVLAVFIAFLAAHPSETVIMRAQKTHTEENVTRTFGETFAWYLSQCGSTVWPGDPTTGFDLSPRLGDVRGKIVILQDFTAFDSQGNAMPPFGIPWTNLTIQGSYIMAWSHYSFNAKWGTIRDYIDAAMTQNPLSWYVNFTCGSTLINPVDVARGIWIPFAYADGMNERTFRYITSCYQSHCAPYLLDRGEHGRLGVIMSDFPGPGLLDAVIAHNDLPRFLANNPPVALAGGPYVAHEGTTILFDASGSTDFEGDPLEYRWDMDGDDVFDTAWSGDSTAAYVWFDDYEGIVQVEASDGDPSRADRDVTAVTVVNVAPEVVVDGAVSVVPGCLLPGQTVEIHGSFADAGCLDTHTARWRFGDQATLVGALAETNDPPQALGTVADPHVYAAPGPYAVELEVLDDDGGLGVGTMDLRVLSAAEALDFIGSHIRGLPDSAFCGPADNRKGALSNKLAAVQQMVTAGNRKAALSKLRHEIRAKTDGFVDGKPQDDWIVDPGAQQQLCLMLDELMVYMEGPYWRGI